jgi:cell division protein FtsB
MSEEGAVGENSVVKANLAFMIKVITGVCFVCYSYVTIKNSISQLENDNARIKHEVEMNSEFRIKWPRGEIGALPADATQDMKIQHLESRVDKLDEHVDKLRHGSSKVGQ